MVPLRDAYGSDGLAYVSDDISTGRDLISAA